MEETLLANWPAFFNSTKLMSFVLQTVQNNHTTLPIITDENIKYKGIKITISHFYWNFDHFNLWIEFTTPLSTNKIAEGTMEINLYSDGNIDHTRTIGNIFCF